MTDRYGSDVLAGDWRARGRRVLTEVPAERDLVLETDDGFCGAVVTVEGGIVHLEDRHGRRRLFPLGTGFLLEGERVSLVAPTARRATGRARSASGSFAVTDAPARVARASRILVEGRHDAELVEKVWGHDLRVEGVVVEYLEGLDRLEDRLSVEPPAPGARVGVLVDHLVTGSKESKIADAVARGPLRDRVLITGHPYIDVWQAVRPSSVGITAWPVVPRGQDWKHGVCDALGWPHEDQSDIARAWQRILGRVSTYRDIEPALLGRVEELIDFVTA